MHDASEPKRSRLRGPGLSPFVIEVTDVQPSRPPAGPRAARIVAVAGLLVVMGA
jgi:hypothetical protein